MVLLSSLQRQHSWPSKKFDRFVKSSYADDDVEAWTPGAVGDRQITDKNLRKRVREAQRAVDGARIASRAATDDADDAAGEQAGSGGVVD